MQCHDDSGHPKKPDGKACPMRRPLIYWAAAGIFAAGGIYYLWAQHRAHVFQYLPFAFFLLCPLMHLFGGHGGHGGHNEKKGTTDGKS